MTSSRLVAPLTALRIGFAVLPGVLGLLISFIGLRRACDVLIYPPSVGGPPDFGRPMAASLVPGIVGLALTLTLLLLFFYAHLRANRQVDANDRNA